VKSGRADKALKVVRQLTSSIALRIAALQLNVSNQPDPTLRAREDCVRVVRPTIGFAGGSMPTEDYDSQELGSTFPGIHMLRMLSLACGIIAIALTALAAKQFFRFGQALGVTSEGKLSPGLWLALLDVKVR
jgi:hypothetical protein